MKGIKKIKSNQYKPVNNSNTHITQDWIEESGNTSYQTPIYSEPIPMPPVNPPKK